MEGLDGFAEAQSVLHQAELGFKTKNWTNQIH
jgi:hypothetical protein